MKNRKPFYYILAVVFIVANFLLMWKFGEEVSRGMRFFTMLLFFVIFYSFIKYSKISTVIFLLFVLCDALLIFYEDPLVKSLTYISRIFAYALLFWIIVPEIRKLKFNFWQIIISMGILLLNVFLLSVLTEMLPEVLNYPIFIPLFYVFGFTTIVLVIAAVSYHNRYSNLQSFFYAAAVFALVLSDLTFYIAHYLNFSIFFYADRLFNILGILSLIMFFQIYSINADTTVNKIGDIARL